MKIYAISDPHISGDGTKPMDVFGGKWVGYLPKIAEDWQKKVDSGDVVVIAGDISWAMDLPEAVKDINGFFTPLKGKKVFVRGNHDYWWKSISRVVGASKARPILRNRTEKYIIAKSSVCGLLFQR